MWYKQRVGRQENRTYWCLHWEALSTAHELLQARANTRTQRHRLTTVLWSHKFVLRRSPGSSIKSVKKISCHVNFEAPGATKMERRATKKKPRSRRAAIPLAAAQGDCSRKLARRLLPAADSAIQGVGVEELLGEQPANPDGAYLSCRFPRRSRKAQFYASGVKRSRANTPKIT